MPEPGSYTLINIGFSRDEKPELTLNQEGKFVSLCPLGKTITLRFDTSQRACIGGWDITTGERFTCEDNNIIDDKYEQCQACQKKTGFNPAFYHATSVSRQQEARNQESHILYLAYFGDGIIKVGISHAARGNSRLLEQGARNALILDTFPSANIARHYEAQIAKLPEVAETIQLRKKIDALSKPYDTQSAKKILNETKTKAERATRVSFAGSVIMSFDDTYFHDDIPQFADMHDCTENQFISGEIQGMLGSLLFCKQQDTPVFLPLKKFTGYSVDLSYDEIPMTLPSRQISLF